MANLLTIFAYKPNLSISVSPQMTCLGSVTAYVR